MTKRKTGDEVLEVAVDLHAQSEAAREAERERIAVREAAAEVGVGLEHVAEAEAEVARRRARSAEESAGRARTLRWVGAALAAVALGAWLWQVTRPAPAQPWVERFADHGRWALDASPGSVARLSYETSDGREVAVVTVDRAAPRDDGTWFVNLDGTGLPPIARHEALLVELSGTLPAARVYLEAGSDERWRSPPIAVQPTWTRHRLPLAAFEHQRRRDGRWQAVGSSEPSNVAVISVKLGHFVNAPAATGVLRVGEIRVE